MAKPAKDDAPSVIQFNQRVRHGKFTFLPGVVYGFEDPDAAPYFKATGWAEDAKGEPAMVLTIGEVDIDPCTIWGDGANKGKFVMPERAAAAREMSLEDARSYVWNGENLRG